jgi:hypothetical protein
MTGDIWAVPAMPTERWEEQPESVWHRVEHELRNGWGGKLKDAYRLVHGQDTPTAGGILSTPVARKANELGAPVGQAFTACSLRERGSR